MKILSFFLLITASVELLFGCASIKGPQFTEMSVESGKTNVYFYRNSLTGSAYTDDFQINRGRTLPLQNKGYYLLVLDPGTYDFAVSYNSRLHAEEKFTFHADETYYIRYRAEIVGERPWLFTSEYIPGYDISSVPRDEALKVLNKCRLIDVLKLIKE